MTQPFLPRTLRPMAAALLLAFAGMPAAHAFSDDEARRAILELREQVRQMSEQNLQARMQLADQIETLRSEVASLRGKVEHLNWQAQQAARNAEAEQSGPQVGDPIEQAAFDAAMEQFRGGKYAEAATGFSDFMAARPSSTLATEAQFYRGSSLYATRKFKDAADTLQALVQSRPDDARAPDALLVVAASQIELNAIKGARATLQKIVKDYPQSNAAQTAKERLKLLS